MPTILSGSFFLIINCLFACFDRISALSVKSGCHIKPARGTRHPYFDEQYQDSVKHGKDCFYQKKKNELLRTVVFHHRKINAYGILQNSFIQTLSPSAITCLSKRKGAFI
jgi:hypothetical protein